MPLSPILANFVLSDFDKTIEKSGFAMVRYADDIVVFTDSLASAKLCQNLIVEELAKLNHRIPALSYSGKTRIAGKNEGFDFLGRSIVFSESAGRFVQKISKKKMDEIFLRIKSGSDLSALIKEGVSFSSFSSRTSRMVSSYAHSYSDAFNATAFESGLRREYSETMRNILSQIFGEDAVKDASPEHLKFLGIVPAVSEYDDLEIVE